MLDFLKGWKTLIFNSIVAALGGLEAADFVDILDPQHIPLALAVVGVVNMALRLITDTPPASSEPKA